MKALLLQEGGAPYFLFNKRIEIKNHPEGLNTEKMA